MSLNSLKRVGCKFGGTVVKHCSNINFSQIIINFSFEIELMIPSKEFLRVFFPSPCFKPLKNFLNQKKPKWLQSAFKKSTRCTLIFLSIIGYVHLSF